MPEYAFTEREQGVIRTLGKLGFRYARETMKTIEFVRCADDNVIELNREHSDLALVFGFGDQTRISGASGIISIGLRSSSNFSRLKPGTTRRGNENHQGIQVVLKDRDSIPSIVQRMS
jgi:hypothetical protein